MTGSIQEQLHELCGSLGSRTLTRQQLVAEMEHRYGRKPGSVIPTDYCYNLWNKGLPNWRPFLEQVAPGEFLFVGYDHPYTGEVRHRPRGSRATLIVGEWVDGKYREFDDPLELDG